MYFRYKTTALFLAVVFLFSVDRFLKAAALAGVNKPIFGDFLSFAFSRNFGIAFSLPFSGWPLLIVVGLIVVVLGHFGFKAFLAQDFYRLSAYGLVIAGAGSNLFDRVKYGFVIDYLDVAYFSILNAADVMIFCGVVWLLFLSYKKGPITE